MRNHVHIIMRTSSERANKARACFSLGFHAEIYSEPTQLISAGLKSGIALIEELAGESVIADFIDRANDAGLSFAVIGLSTAPEMSQIVSALSAGAVDYLAMPVPSEQLEKTLLKVDAYESAYGETRRRAARARLSLSQLTGRERQVLDLLATGLNNKLIGRTLEISSRTVEIHRGNMMRKLGASHSAQAIMLHFEATLGPNGKRGQLPITQQAVGF